MNEMDEFAEGYQEEEYNKPINLEERDYRMQIINVEKTYTKQTGAPMLVVDLRINEAPITFKHRIVKNEYFNGNMTKFFDCFNIPHGNFDYAKWAGKVGTVRIHKGDPNGEGKAYWEIHYLVVAPKAGPTAGPRPGPQAQQPAAARPASAYQQPARQPEPAGASSFDDDIPWKGTF